MSLLGSLSSISETYDQGLEKTVARSGFRSELFTVAAGSYAANQSYGSGAVSTGSLASVSTSDSQCKIRKQDADVDFSIDVVLDTTAAAPGLSAGDELRVRSLRPVGSNNPARYSAVLPVPDRKFGLPLILDVEVVNELGLAPSGFPSVAGVGQLQARLLHGGELALVVRDGQSGPSAVTTPLTFGDVSPLFGQDESVIIRVRGTYRGISRGFNN